MIKLTVLAGPDAGSMFTSTTDTVVIGRGQNCEVVLHDSIVSRRHCVIQYEREDFVVADLHTANGTFLNDAKTRIYTRALRNGDELILGNSRLRIELPGAGEKKPVAMVTEPPAETTPDPRSSAVISDPPSWCDNPLESLPGSWQSGMTVIVAHPKMLPVPQRSNPAEEQPRNGPGQIVARVSAGLKTIKFTVVDGPDAGSVFTPISGTVVIGRGQNCEVVLHDSIVSRRHCVVRSEREDFVVTDLHTANGTFLNSPKMRISSCALRNGDEIVLGKSRLRVELPVSEKEKPVTIATESAVSTLPSSPSVAAINGTPSWFTNPLESLPGGWQSGMTVMGALPKMSPVAERLIATTELPEHRRKRIVARITAGLKRLAIALFP